ncbi:MAG: hypothetical protein U0R70_01985 [Solirubrobacteraceae bacterium]
MPGSATAAGSISLKGATIGALGTTFFRGTLTLTLPAGKRAGQEAEVGSLDVASGAQLHGFGIVGSLPLTLGLNTAGRYYANVTLAVALPKVFKAGPAKDAPGLTSKVVVSFDRNGVSTTGIKLEAQDAYIGLPEDPVAVLRLRGRRRARGRPVRAAQARRRALPHVRAGRDRGPLERQRRRPAADGVEDAAGRLRLGVRRRAGEPRRLRRQARTSVPLTTGVYLNRVGVGICVKPPPFKLRGDVGVSILPNASGTPTVAVNGYFIYTDPNGSDPWSLELGGTVLVLNKQVGSGKVIIKGSGALDFEVQVGIEFGIVKVEGGVSGWIEPALRRFLVQGSSAAASDRSARAPTGSCPTRASRAARTSARSAGSRSSAMPTGRGTPGGAFTSCGTRHRCGPASATRGSRPRCRCWDRAATSDHGRPRGPRGRRLLTGGRAPRAWRPAPRAWARASIVTARIAGAGAARAGVGAAPKVRISGPGGVTVQSAADAPAARVPGRGWSPRTAWTRARAL